MFSTSWRRLSKAGLNLPLILIIAAGIIVTIWHIDSSPAYLSPTGASARAASSSLLDIYHNPINAPHKILVFAAGHIGGGIGVLRLASYLMAMVFAVSFYRLSKGLFGSLVGALSTILFTISPFFIIPARQASAQIMLFSPLALMALYVWFIRTDKKYLAWLLIMTAAGLFIYTPGIAWWLLIAALIGRKKLLASIATLPEWLVGIGAMIFLILLVPACVSIIHEWHLIKGYLLIPNEWPAPLAAVKDFGWMIAGMFIRTPHTDPLILGRLPLLDVIQTALLIFGAFALWSAARAKVFALIIALVLAAVVAAVNDNIALLFLGLPAAGLLMAAGLRYLYVEWRGIFPRNPLAKSLALLFMVALVVVQMIYGLRYSLQAWPDSKATKSTYMLK